MAPPCPTCDAVARDCAVLNVLRTCPACGQRWVPAETIERSPDPVRDLERLARYLPWLTGKALSAGLDGAAHVPGDGNRGGASPNALAGRPDFIDEKNADLRRAVATLSRLDRMERAGRRLECEVLWYAYVVCGPQLARTHKGGLADLVAEKFSDRERLAYWRTHKSRKISEQMPAAFGTELLERAHAAYQGAGLTASSSPPQARALPLSTQLDRLLEEALDSGVAPRGTGDDAA